VKTTSYHYEDIPVLASVDKHAKTFIYLRENTCHMWRKYVLSYNLLFVLFALSVNYPIKRC